MSDELKSAYERALEKLKEKGIDEPVEPVTAEQKQEIEKIRSLYRSKIAELEIRTQTDTRKAIVSQNYEVVAKIQESFVSERARLEQELERKLAELRQERSDRA